MKVIIMANGQYGELDYYRPLLCSADRLICADGGANYACQLELTPHLIVGDMDSIRPEVLHYYQDRQVPLKKCQPRKDFTDTQLAIATAAEMGAAEIVLCGTMGGRLDHCLSNLYAGIESTRSGIMVRHVNGEGIIQLFEDSIEIDGNPGDIVSILPLTETIERVYTEGLEYRLNGEKLIFTNPYAVSNLLIGQRAVIRIEGGVGALFHYYR